MTKIKAFKWWWWKKEMKAGTRDFDTSQYTPQEKTLFDRLREKQNYAAGNPDDVLEYNEIKNP